MVPIISGSIHHLTGMSQLSKSKITLALGLMMVTVQCPAMTFISFTYKKRKEGQSRKLSREARLRKVLHHAEEERAAMMVKKVSLTVAAVDAVPNAAVDAVFTDAASTSDATITAATEGAHHQ
jgi:hypothetical protein